MKGENKLVKRQTVWLLTMLSLMIVLSAYYMLSDKEELAYIDENEEDQSVNQEQSEATSDVDIEDVRNVEGNDFFTTIRMELQDKRNIQKDRRNKECKDIINTNRMKLQDKRNIQKDRL